MAAPCHGWSMRRHCDGLTGGRWCGRAYAQDILHTAVDICAISVLKTCPGLVVLEVARRLGVRFRRLNGGSFRLHHSWAHTCWRRSRGPQDYHIFHAAVDALCDQRLENLSRAGVDGGCQVLRSCLGILECLHKRGCHQKPFPDFLRCGFAARCCRCRSEPLLSRRANSPPLKPLCLKP